MKKIGLAIALGKDANSHTRTFIEAINYSLKNFPEFKQHSLKIVDDEKSPEGGEKAAIELVEWGADVVVGHSPASVRWRLYLFIAAMRSP